MVKSAENGSRSVPPFLKKCYEMVDDESTNSVISWSGSNDRFVIWDMTEFSVRLLPNYFKHNNFSSFIRQLNIYGFKKIDTDRWEFANDGFIRGQKHLLKNISRRKHPHIQDQHKAQQQDNCDEPSEEFVNHGLWKEVENLKTDKNAIMQQMVKLRLHQESAENKLLLLRNRLQGMEKNQQQMLSFLVTAMQIPGFMVHLLQPKENNSRMAEAGNILEQSKQDDRSIASGMMIKYKPPVGEHLKPVVPLSSGSEKQPEPDLSADGLEDSFVNSDFLKVLMDEKLCPLENYSPFILADLPDDGAWEQLLLGRPSFGNIEDSNLDSEETAIHGMEMEPLIAEIPNENSQNFESLIEEMKNT